MIPNIGQTFSLLTLGTVGVGTYKHMTGTLGDSVANFVGPIVNGAIRGFDGTGKEVNSVLGKIVTEMRIGEIVQKAVNELDSAAAQGISAVKIDEHMGAAAEKMRLGGDKVADQFDIFTKRLIADGAGNLGGAIKGAAANTIPWMVLSTVLLAGTPLAMHYIYKKFVHSIGRPKLAGEVKYVGLYERVTDLGARGVNNVAKCLKAGVKTAVTTSMLGYTASTGVFAITLGRAMGAHVAGGHLSENDIDRFSQTALDLVFGVPRMMIEGTRCSSWNDTCRRENNIVEMFALGCLAAGATVTLAQAARIIKNGMKTIGKKEPTAYFNDEVTQVIKDFTESTTNTKRHGGYFQNLLLYGPGGTGKTMISKIIAKNSGINYVMMSGGDLAQYIKRGEHVTELNKLFEDAKNSFTPTIITIDECESMCRDRDKMDKQELIELLNAFLNHTGVPSKNVLLVLITNRMEDLDEAVLSRMDHKVYIGPPARTQREKIIEQYARSFFNKKDMNKFFNEAQRLAITDQVEGLTGRAIFKMMNSINGKKLASKHNILTQEMIDSTIKHFVEQEKRIEEARAKKISNVASTNNNNTLTEDRIDSLVKLLIEQGKLIEDVRAKKADDLASVKPPNEPVKVMAQPAEIAEEEPVTAKLEPELKPELEPKSEPVTVVEVIKSAEKPVEIIAEPMKPEVTISDKKVKSISNDSTSLNAVVLAVKNIYYKVKKALSR